MSDAASATAPITACRRCGGEFVPSSSMLASCPHCGKSVEALWRRSMRRHNGLSAVCALVALVVLSVAIASPFISMSKLGLPRIFSLVGGVKELFDQGNWFIGTVLLVFSLIFPFAKLLAILLTTSSMTRLSLTARRRMHHIAMLTGKYSLLDILVVAIMIVLVKFNGIAEVRAEPGTILFCVAILLSIASGALVDLNRSEESTQ